MKQPRYLYIYFIICSLVLTGCDKYLDVEPKGKTILTSVTNYDQWLNDPMIEYGVGASYATMNNFGDNYDILNVTTPAVTAVNLMYTWALQFSTDLQASPEYWGFHYKLINHFNTVLLGIDNATGGTIVQKKSLKAEALLGRAYEYLYLVNEYGNPYDSATASQDLAVPFVTSNDVSQVVPPRTTVAAVYNNIIADLLAAIPDLPLDNTSNRYRGSKAAAYSLLARTYLYARNYADAGKYAQLALDNTKAVMINYNNAATAPASNLISTWPDAIYARYLIGQALPTIDFLRSFTAEDLRLKKLYYSTEAYALTKRNATYFYPGFINYIFLNINTGTSVPEMRLIAAESAARGNNLSLALQHLDEMRKNRYATASYVPFQSTEKETVLKEVLLERGHELAFVGLRWFDMRRLDKENRMGAVNRYDAQGNIVATLPPHSPRYTLQIPVQVLTYNPDMPQNP